MVEQNKIKGEENMQTIPGTTRTVAKQCYKEDVSMSGWISQFACMGLILLGELIRSHYLPVFTNH
jgi:hypothetical protein